MSKSDNSKENAKENAAVDETEKKVDKTEKKSEITPKKQGEKKADVSSKKPSDKKPKQSETAKKTKRSPLKWFKEARAEFKKVTWPTPKQVVKNTSIVLTLLVIAGVSVWGLDKLLDLLFKFIMATKK